MAKARAAGRPAKSIETAFVGSNPILPKTTSDIGLWPRAWKANNEEWLRVRAELDRRLQLFFSHCGIDRTGDDAVDFMNLAVRMSADKYPEFSISADPCRLELLFPLLQIEPTGNEADDYRTLAFRLSGLYFEVGPKPYVRKRSNSLTLLLLLGDVEVAKRATKESLRTDDRAVQDLIAKEPFRASWAGMTKKTLLNWLADARDPEKNLYLRHWRAYELSDDLPRLIEAVNTAVRGKPNP